ncbi:MAG: YbjQ family protein [Chloroflexota bacterium]
MQITTTYTFPGYEITETLGVVRGNTVRARHIGKDIMAGLRNIVGGEIGEYTKLLAESREQALDRMLANAKEVGADGVVGVRFVTSTVSQAAAELLVYGTAVKLQKSDG